MRGEGVGGGRQEPAPGRRGEALLLGLGLGGLPGGLGLFRRLRLGLRLRLLGLAGGLQLVLGLLGGGRLRGPLGFRPDLGLGGVLLRLGLLEDAVAQHLSGVRALPGLLRDDPGPGRCRGLRSGTAVRLLRLAPGHQVGQVGHGRQGYRDLGPVLRGGDAAGADRRDDTDAEHGRAAGKSPALLGDPVLAADRTNRILGGIPLAPGTRSGRLLDLDAFRGRQVGGHRGTLLIDAQRRARARCRLCDGWDDRAALSKGNRRRGGIPSFSA